MVDAPSGAAPLVRTLHWSERDRLREVLRESPLVHVTCPVLPAKALVDFASSLGSHVVHHRSEFQLAGHPEVMLMGNVKDPLGRAISGSAIGRGWHSDMSYTAEPPELTFLYGVTVPSSGGDTQFRSLYALHDGLDDRDRRRWAPLKVEHVYRSKSGGEDLSAVHPLVRRHPSSGRTTVYASPAFASRVQDVSPEESSEILGRVAAALEPPDVVHRWKVGDLIVWDNRGVVHRATPFDGAEQRCCWRMTIRLGGEGS